MTLVEQTMNELKAILEYEIQFTPHFIQETRKTHMKQGFSHVTHKLCVGSDQSDNLLAIERVDVDCFAPYRILLFGPCDEYDKRLVSQLWRWIDEIEEMYRTPYTILNLSYFGLGIETADECGVFDYYKDAATIFKEDPLLNKWYDAPHRKWVGNVRDRQMIHALHHFEQEVFLAFREAACADPTIEVTIPTASNKYMCYYVSGEEGTLHRHYDAHGMVYTSRYHSIRSVPSHTRSDVSRFISAITRERVVRNALNPPRYHYDRLLTRSIAWKMAKPLYNALRTVMSPVEIEHHAATTELLDIHYPAGEWFFPYLYGYGFGYYLFSPTLTTVHLFKNRNDWLTFIRTSVNEDQQATLASVESYKP